MRCPAILFAAALAVGAGAHAATPPRALRISPSGEIPANTLRFYVDFAGAADAVFERQMLQLQDSSGRGLPDPFLDLGQELWSPDGRRLTLIVNPANIKRGVTNQGDSTAFSTGKTYRLKVGALASRLSVTAPNRTPLDESNWSLNAPQAGSRQPLEIKFDRVMDEALSEDEIDVFDADGALVAGRSTLVNDGPRLEFRPDRPWRTGRYTVRYSDQLEDVSGNRLGEPLDHEVGEFPGGPRSGQTSFRIQKKISHTRAH